MAADMEHFVESLVNAAMYGFTAAALGAAVACCLCWFAFGRAAAVRSAAEARRAAEVLVRLQELAARMAMDVGEHSSQLAEVNEELIASEGRNPAAVVELVARLVELNHRMFERLASTEEKLREQAEEIQAHAAEARTDSLTLLANRRAFDDELARRLAEFRRQGRVFSLVLADVDHFKRVNDLHGHQVGDNVLRDVARLLRRRFRDMDVVARYGGEEFAVILPGTDLDEACQAAFRAREALEQSRFHYGGKEITLTSSFGVAQAQIPEDGATLIARADKALYAAKEGGRNAVFGHDGRTVFRVSSEKGDLPPRGRPQAAPPTLGQADSGQADSGQALASRERATPAPLPDVDPLDASPLAHLATRTSFCQMVRNRTAEWKRGGRTFSVALVEVSQCPPGSGDRRAPAEETAAPLVGRFLAGSVREMDVAAEYAPGCLALLFPDVVLADALRLADRVREGIAEWEHPSEPCQMRYTASVGVVEVMRDDDFLSVLRRAEAALDAADRQGGNQTWYHDGRRCLPAPAALEPAQGLA